jgi:putative tryptophan/tyrosine transport system substrate-binding protein
MKRRTFITLLGGAAAVWPLAARAQQPTMPVIGLLSPGSPSESADLPRALRQGLKEAGYVEGENVAIEDRWAEDQIEELPAMADELVRRPVAVILAIGHDAAFAAKAATTTIPIVFLAGEDPVKVGLVASLSRPGGNATGINFFVAELVPKRLELLGELVPGTVRVAVLANPPSNATTEAILRGVEVGARTLGLRIQVLHAGTSREIESAFASLARERPDALFISPGPFFTSRRVQIVQLATHHRIPTTYAHRQFAEVGGLMSYGASLTDSWRQIGAYAGRILKGAKVADMPVVQSSKFELVINHPTARMLGLTVPPSLLTTADEVIE